MYYYGWDTLAEVLKTEPNWDILPAGTPPAIRQLLRRCLEKDRRRRLDSAAAARLDIEEVLMGGSRPTKPTVTTKARGVSSRRWMRIALAPVVAAGSVALGAWRYFNTPSPLVVRLAATAAGDVGDEYFAADVAITPDGHRIVFTSGRDPDPAQLFVRRLDQLEPISLLGLGAPVNPFISPDGQWIGYFDGPTVMKRVNINGGPPMPGINCICRGSRDFSVKNRVGAAEIG